MNKYWMCLYKSCFWHERSFVCSCLHTCCCFPKCRVWASWDFWWLLGRSCCCLRCCSHWALGRAVRLAAKVLSFQLGVRLKSLQNCRLALLHRWHKQSAELTARGREVRMLLGTEGNDTLGRRCVEQKLDCNIRLSSLICVYVVDTWWDLEWH